MLFLFSDICSVLMWVHVEFYYLLVRIDRSWDTGWIFKLTRPDKAGSESDDRAGWFYS